MRILAVDNDPIVLETLVQLLLQDARFDAVAALTGAAALSLLDDPTQAPFDCVLIDAQLAADPTVNLIDTIRGHIHYATTPIIVMSDSRSDDVLDAVMSPGIDDYLVKPFSIAAFLTSLQIASAPAAPPAPTTAPARDEPEPLAALLPVTDAKGFLETPALENYARQLPRPALYSANIFAVAIRDIGTLHANLSPFEFHALINDIAGILTEETTTHRCLMAYTGDGVFVGLSEDHSDARLAGLKNRINALLEDVAFTDAENTRLQVRVSAGEPVRLTWKSKDAIPAAFAQARAQAIAARQAFEALRGDFWFLERSA